MIEHKSTKRTVFVKVIDIIQYLIEYLKQITGIP